jgi:predicted glycosyltransferase
VSDHGGPDGYELERLEVKPGDWIVVKLSATYVRVVEVDHIRAELQERFPDSQILVVVGGVEIDSKMLERATEAVVEAHAEEMAACLRGDFAPNQWRPERYAEAALRAALVTDAVEEAPDAG